MLWFLSIVVIILLVVRRWKIQKFVNVSKELKCGIKSYPLIGHAHLLAGGGVNRMTVIKKFSHNALKNGGLSYIWIGSKFYVETALGVKLKVNGNTEKQLMESFDILFKLMTTRMVEPWLQLDALYKLLPQHNNFEKNKEILRSFVNEIIKEKRKKIKENIKTDNDDTKVTKSFLDLYIESSGGDRGCTDEELLEETLVMLLAGTDTSAVGLCFTICMLAQYPDVQEKVFQELQEVFGDSERQVVVEDLPRLKYLEAVFRESLRLYPPVPLIVREINEDIKLPSGVTLKKGCGFLALIWGLHRNPLYWGEDAEQFRPERFLEGHSRHPAAFLTFSHGPRNCLGE
ncbi:unnamed protein product [Arctia plantaginis]|uniref:Cytochrome P450 n=1 Tax=Arctia plantaginis TaxID=874455 RepID=A0A8S0ZKD9_ARCPL|nr:unnamed protein product [Arctia plantaginis]